MTDGVKDTPKSFATAERGAQAVYAHICAGPGCGLPVDPKKGQQYCSANCRWKAWDVRHPRERDNCAQGRLFGTELHVEEAEKKRGMEVSAAKSAEWLRLARLAAGVVAQMDGTADIERVRMNLSDRPDIIWGNWAGSVFTTGEWVPTGDFVKARHKGGHCRMVRVWRRR